MKFIWNLIIGRDFKYPLVPVTFNLEHLYSQGHEKIFQGVLQYGNLKEVGVIISERATFRNLRKHGEEHLFFGFLTSILLLKLIFLLNLICLPGLGVAGAG